MDDLIWAKMTTMGLIETIISLVCFMDLEMSSVDGVAHTRSH